MILLDTNVIIDFWRAPDEQIGNVLKHNELAICSVTRCELLHGAKDEADLTRITSALVGLHELPIDAAVWDLLGPHLFHLRRAGVVVPFQDALIATVAIRHRTRLWSFDGHFTLIRDVLDQLELFSAS